MTKNHSRAAIDNALVIANEVIIPLQVHIYALRGMQQLQKTISLVRKINQELHISGIVCTMVDRTTVVNHAMEPATNKTLSF